MGRRLKHYPGYISTSWPGVMSTCSGIMFTGGRQAGVQRGKREGREGAAEEAAGRRYSRALVIVGSESRVIALDKQVDRCNSVVRHSRRLRRLCHASAKRRRRRDFSHVRCNLPGTILRARGSVRNRTQSVTKRRMSAC